MVTLGGVVFETLLKIKFSKKGIAQTIGANLKCLSQIEMNCSPD